MMTAISGNITNAALFRITLEVIPDTGPLKNTAQSGPAFLLSVMVAVC
jgi:hypothetical protein